MSALRSSSTRPPARLGRWGPLAAVLAGAAALAPSPLLAVAPTPPPPPDYVAPFQSGETLWADCGRTAQGPPPEACWIYVAGVSDGVLSASGARQRPYCLDDQVQAGQLADIVRRYLAAHAEARRKAAAGLVVEALKQAFPCATGEPR
ncbi:MAG: Rap1a/Tai family immunity protein [Caulobacterales bacterium]